MTVIAINITVAICPVVVITVFITNTITNPGSKSGAEKNPGSFNNDFGNVGACPEAASDAMKTRSEVGSGYRTAGVNSSCPE